MSYCTFETWSNVDCRSMNLPFRRPTFRVESEVLITHSFVMKLFQLADQIWTNFREMDFIMILIWWFTITSILFFVYFWRNLDLIPTIGNMCITDQKVNSRLPPRYTIQCDLTRRCLSRQPYPQPLVAATIAWRETDGLGSIPPPALKLWSQGEKAFREEDSLTPQPLNVLKHTDAVTPEQSQYNPSTTSVPVRENLTARIMFKN